MLVNAENLAAVILSLRSEFQAGLTGYQPMWNRVATRIPSNLRAEHYGWLGSWPKLRKWIGDKVIENLAHYNYSLVNEDYESTVEIRRNDLEDDALGQYAPLARAEGQAAGEWPDENVFPLLTAGFSSACYDGKPFFSASHKMGTATYSNTGGGSGTGWYLLDVTRPLLPLIFQERKSPQFVEQTGMDADAVFMRGVYRQGIEARGAFGYGLWQLAYGSKQDLTSTNYNAARQAMMAIRDDKGRPLAIRPSLLVVPTTLESTGRALLEKEYLAAGENNMDYHTAELLVCPYLP